MPRAILHIGMEKTGTTAIQDYLGANRAELRRQGFYLSHIPNGQNHLALAAYAIDDGKLNDDVRMAYGLNSSEKLAEFRNRIDQQIAAEVASAPDCTFIFSGEHCHSRLVNPTEVARLRGLLDKYFDDVRIIVYLRRQDQVAVSHYSTLIKAGGTRGAILDANTLGRSFLDYEKLLERWAGVFGRQALTVALFDRSAFVGGSIIPDFCARTGLPLLNDGGKRANESLRPIHQEFLRRMNERLPRFVNGALNPARGDIDRYVSLVGSGTGRRPAASTAWEYYEPYRESNEAVRALYFPERGTLFDEDFSSYPEKADPPELSLQDALDIVAEIWRASTNTRYTLQARLKEAETALASASAKSTAAPAPSSPPLAAAPPKPAAAAKRLKPPPMGPGIVNRGYQNDDINIIDYRLWDLGDQQLRGPAPDPASPYFAAIGAAQVFGRFVEKPFPTLIAERTGLQALNLGMSGAGPSFFLQRPELLDAANRAQFVILQLMSGRSVNNRLAAVGNNQGVMRLRSDPETPPQFAEDVYRGLLDTLPSDELAALRAENRDAYVSDMSALIAKIERPIILLYWSKRAPDYTENQKYLAGYWADFPHFVNREVIEALTPQVDRYVEVVTERGLPQPLFHRETGAPIEMWPEDRFPLVRMRHHNHYYPSPEMNEDVADALAPAVEAIRTRGGPAIVPAARPQVRDVLVHVPLDGPGEDALAYALATSFSERWREIKGSAGGATLAAVASDQAVEAITANGMHLPLPQLVDVRLHPVLLLSHPARRARWIYAMKRAEEQGAAGDEHARMAKSLDFPGWIEWCLSRPDLAAPIANDQTRRCAPRKETTVSLIDFRAASALLQQAQVGTVETLAQSFLAIERALHTTFPGLRLLAPPANDYHAQANPRGELGDALYRRLAEANAYDLLLWQRATAGS